MNDSAGVNVPGLRILDAPSGVLGLEWIDGVSVRKLLPDDSPEDEGPEVSSEEENTTSLDDFGLTVGTYLLCSNKDVSEEC
jgi:TP53 regulating kinase-like protein